VRGNLVAVALASAAVLLLAGCGGRPPGVDGNLTNNWPAMPDAKLPVPAAQACYPEVGVSPGAAKLPGPVDCATPHNLETIHVGTFTGEVAAGDTVPPEGSAPRQQAYEDCTRATRDLTGGDWRAGRIGLDLVLPTAGQWEAEARWYRCDLVEFKDLESYDVATRTGSLKGGLAGDRPVALGCFNVATKGDAVDTMQAADCATGHNAEFAGVWEAPAGTYPSDPGKREQAQIDGCRKVVASFAGIADDDKFRYRVGQITYGFGKADWDLGNRGVRCYIWMEGKSFTRSLKGTGPNGLPINYA
jgi:hypothetical protein